MRQKVRAMGRMGKMYTVLKEEHETLLQIKNLAPDGKIPKGLLLEGRPAIKHALKSFELARKLDAQNEKKPPSSITNRHKKV
jgi:serine/threonine-protein phosphatase 2B catalytic subunit